ncbi:uncharacterized protein LOC133199202 [Saccostrea echinata]|uniref:uncharacterized protein LOC133199202 n=1 Tax=Saccostrea echinata TaxID=191078 RepID=UPI002A800E95|nr:uncharacterized protein LOC133199202 [Saccostrea echinata]
MAALHGEIDMVTSDQALQELIADNSVYMYPTKRRIRTSLSIFRTYLLEKNLQQSVEKTYSSEQLNNLLTNFYLEMKKPDGKHYAGTSVMSIRYGLQKHFLKLRNEDIIRNEKYSSCNKMFKEVLVKLRKEEIEFQKGRISIHPDDVAKLYNTVFSTDSPKGLQRKTIFEFIYYFCDRGREHLRRVRKEDFVFSKDASGREYVTVKGRYSKKESREKLDTEPARMYDHPGNPMCPVTSFKKYLTKLNPINPYFWQRPRKLYDPSDTIWYENSPLGKNTLSSLMINLSVEAKLSKKYSNSSIRATNITILDSQSEEATNVISASNGCQPDQSVKENSSVLTDNKKCEVAEIPYKNLPPKTVSNDAAAPSDLSHQDSCVDCDNETGTPNMNEYRNILIGEAAIAWKQLIGRCDWLNDSELANHLIQVHEVYCRSRGICPLERTHDVQMSDPVYRKSIVDVIPPIPAGEREDMSLQLEVDEVIDSVDDDSSGDSDLESEEEIEGKEEPYSMDSISPNPGYTQQGEGRVSTTDNESLNSGGDNLSHVSTEVKQEPVDSYSVAENITVTNINSNSSGDISLPQSVTNDLVMRSSFTSPNIYQSPSTHFQNTVGSAAVIGNPTANTKRASVNVAKTSLLTTLKHIVIRKQTTTTGANQVQRSLPFRLSSAQGVKNIDPPTGLFNTGQGGSTLYIQKGSTPNSILVRPQKSGLFQPATLNLLTRSEIQSSPAADRFRVLPNLGQPAPVSSQPVLTSPSTAFSVIRGGQETLPASTGTLTKRGQQITPISSVSLLKGEVSPASISSLLREKPSPVSGVSLLQGQTTPVSGVSLLQGQTIPVSGVSLLRGQTTPVSGVSLLQGQTTPVSGVSFLQGQTSLVSHVSLLQGQTSPVSGASLLQGQTTPVSDVSLLQGQTTPVSGVSLLQGQTTPASNVSSFKGAEQSSPASGVSEGQQASPVPGVLFIRGREQTSFGKVSHSGFQQMDNGQEQKEKKEDLADTKKFSVYNRPLGAYLLWFRANRKDIKKQNPQLSCTDLDKKAREMWKDMGDKTEWIEKAAEAKKEFEKAMEEYISQQTESSEDGEEKSSKDRESRKKRKSPKMVPCKSESERQGGQGTNYKNKEYTSRSGESSGSDSEDKPRKKKSKRDKDSKENFYKIERK